MEKELKLNPEEFRLDPHGLRGISNESEEASCYRESLSLFPEYLIKKDKETYGVIPIDLEVIMFAFLRGCYLHHLDYVIKDFGEIELFFKDITIGDLGRFYSEHIDSFSGVNYSKIYNSICMNDSYSDMSVYDFICSKLECGIIYSEMDVSFSERFFYKANLEIWIEDVCSMMFVNKKKGNH